MSDPHLVIREMRTEACTLLRLAKLPSTSREDAEVLRWRAEQLNQWATRLEEAEQQRAA